MQTCLQDAAVVAILVQNHVVHSLAVQSLAAQNHAVLNHAVLSLAAHSLAVLSHVHVLVQNHAAEHALNQFVDVETAVDHAVDVTVIQITVMETVATLTKMVVKAATEKTVHLSTKMVVT